MNFSDHPVSLAEVKSDRTGNAADWTPRDCLIDLLRKIDQGEISPETLVVCWSRSRDSTADTHYSAASPNPLLTLGTVARALHRLNHVMDNTGQDGV